jgi:hypothetical protein
MSYRAREDRRTRKTKEKANKRRQGKKEVLSCIGEGLNKAETNLVREIKKTGILWSK